MTNAELIKALRGCKDIEFCTDCPMLPNGLLTESCHIKDIAADALEAAEKRIEELEAETERLKASNEELRERQTYIDHWGNKWMTSGKDVPTAAYNHGFLDGEQSMNNCCARMKGGQE